MLEHKKELTQEHKTYLDDLMIDIVDATKPFKERRSAEDMYLMRMIRLDRMGYDMYVHSEKYRVYMQSLAYGDANAE